jgi:hypothetical protein
LTNKYGSNTHAFYEIEKGIDELYRFTPAEQASVDPQQSSISSLQTNLAHYDSLRNAGAQVNEAEYAQWLANLATASNNLRNTLTNIRSTHTAQANALLVQNDAIPITEAWESAAREVNRFYLWAYIQDDVLNATQLDRLDQIASGCVALEGDAIIRAQNLYNLFAEKEYVNTLDCLGPRSKGKKADKWETLVLSPNPTTGIVNLPDLQGIAHLIQVFDLNGKIATETRTNDKAIDLGQLSNGIYFLRMTNLESGSNTVSKITIQH